MIPDPSNPQALNRYSYVGNNPVNFNDPTGHSADCGLGDSYCGAGKINVTKRASNLFKNLPNRKGRNWISLSASEKSILSEGGWDEGAFNDKGGASKADVLHDPATYIIGAVTGGGLLSTGYGLLASAMAGGPGLNGTTVYRVWGDDPSNPGMLGSSPWGPSWSTVDPSTVKDFRDFGGIPSGGESGAFNTGRFVSEGIIIDASGITQRSALSLDGNRGGLLEYLIPKAIEQIQIINVSGVNPPY